jgi:hypothetical protein
LIYRSTIICIKQTYIHILENCFGHNVLGEEAGEEATGDVSSGDKVSLADGEVLLFVFPEMSSVLFITHHSGIWHGAVKEPSVLGVGAGRERLPKTY